MAIIMDGNGRWAKERGKPRTYGHTKGVEAVREAIAGARLCGVRYLTIYAFSTENWQRPAEEVAMLMNLMEQAIAKYADQLAEEGVKVTTIGDLSVLSPRLQKKIANATARTAGGDQLQLLVALNYGGRQEIARAAKRLAVMAKNGEIDPEAIDEKNVAGELYTAGIPDPELLIRTSGEERLSNFLLWQLAYAEFLFLPKYWPDFTREDFQSAVQTFRQRNRRFGGL